MNVKGIFTGFVVFMVIILAASLTLLVSPTETADVVIIGAGASGMAAAIEANGFGHKVIILEKMPYVGGNTLRATAGINGVKTPQQAAFNIEDDEALFKQDIFESGHDSNNEVMIDLMVKESAQAISWLTLQGVDLQDVGILAGHSVARTHRPSGGKPVGRAVVEALYAKLIELDIDLRTEHKAIEIVVDASGAVSGVKIEDKSGKVYHINTKNVIISTGGFGGSPETFVYYNQKLKGYATTNSPSATGDFISLVEHLNVQLVDMGYIQTHPTVSTSYGMLITEALRGNGGILVNNSGLRFADEMKNRDLLSADLLAQDNKEVYLIFNEEIRRSLAASDDYIDMNIVVEGMDLPSLAARLRIDQMQLESTIVAYNGYVEKGIDEAFNRKSLKFTLEQGPYYAVAVIPAVHYCMGGILIDSSARVIDEKGVPIPGLYASGEATGGIHGLNRLGGNSLLDAVVFGRIAGRNIK